MRKIDKQSFKKTLYKYREADLGIQILCERLVKITKPKELNDPFELIPALNMNNEEERQAIKETVRRMKNETTIFSLSSDPTNNCMWAHYANNFKGICIGINTEFFFEEIDLYTVDYKLTRPKIDHIEIKKEQSELDDFIMDLMLSKSIHWQEEDEYRYLFNITGEDIEKELILFPFKSISIVEIIVGPRIEKALLERLQNILAQDNYDHVKIFGLEYQDTTSYSFRKYGIDLKELTNHQNRCELS
jgi:hypothetical protein